MEGQNRWKTFLLICIFKAADTSPYRVLNSSVQGLNIIHDYNLDNKIQDSQTAFQITEDSLRNSRRIKCSPQNSSSEVFSINTNSNLDYTTAFMRDNTRGRKPQKYEKNCNKCGIANTNSSRSPRRIKIGTKEDTRIVNGKQVRPHRKYPWQVGIFNKWYLNGRFFCGGTIINNKWILTAAHCFYYNCEFDTEIVNGYLYVRVGEHKQSKIGDNDKENTQNYRVISIKAHPRNEKYCPKFLNYDFALLELENIIPFNEVIRPVCLPEDDSKKYSGEMGIISGWGVTRLDMWSDVLMEVDFPIKRNKKCKYVDVEDTQICGGPVAYTGPCNGDSGGPLLVKEGDKHIQVGVVSFGDTQPYCGSLASNVFGRVSTVLNWIQETTSNGGC